MPGIAALPPFAGPYLGRILHALDGRRLAAVAAVTMLLSLGPMLTPGLLDFFSPGELALAWVEHFAELAVIGAAILLVYTMLDEGLPRPLTMRLAIVCAGLVVASAVMAVLLYAYYAHGFDHLPPTLRVLADALRWGLPAVYLALIADVQRRAYQTDSAATSAELSRARVGHGESEQQLALLQAQIEPHFLFNMLGNVRRLYQTRPAAGVDAITSLMRYLRTALPQVRNRSGSLADEIELVRSYLDLFRIRMGDRLSFAIVADPDTCQVAFPPMLVITLVENAIRHGLEPVGGGHVLVRAHRQRDRLVVEVHDDGAGFGAAASSGTGVGLTNVRRQLAALYQDQARLVLMSAEPRGAIATLSIPWLAPAVLKPEPAASTGGDALAGPGAPAGPDAVSQAGLAGNVSAAVAPPQHRIADMRDAVDGFLAWCRTHRAAVNIAALLSFAAPVTYFTGALSVMREPTAMSVAQLAAWWVVFGVELWCLVLVIGYVSPMLMPAAGRTRRSATWLLLAGAASACASVSTAGRAGILLGQGVVQNEYSMHASAVSLSFVMVYLCFAHLGRSGAHQAAAARLAAAQTSLRDAQRRITQSRLQAMQARIDPRLLFDMLETVRRLYEHNAGRATSLLDELIRFLRAALPQSGATSSNVAREAELARAYAQLHALAAANRDTLTVDIASQALHARFPPGVLLPLVEEALRSQSGPCRLQASRDEDCCRLVLTLPAAPSQATVSRVRQLLVDVYGIATDLTQAPAPGPVRMNIKVPYETC